MKLLFDFLPILLFFAAFKLFGIYIAVAVAMGASLIQVSVVWFKNRRFETMQLITLGVVLLLGSATLLLRDIMFIKWKPTVVYWVFAVFFFATQYVGKKPLIQRMMEEKLTLQTSIWRRLNMAWSLFFASMGFANLYVVYNYSTETWVNFKLFGTLGLTLLFILIQALYMARYIDKPSTS